MKVGCEGCCGCSAAYQLPGDTLPVKGGRYDSVNPAHFDTAQNGIELLSLSLVCRDPVNVVSLPSLGGGTYDIDSFFDVFTELSIDGGPFLPTVSGLPTRITLVPEPATIALLGLGGLALLRKRKKD